jgi:hypothetical protein
MLLAEVVAITRHHDVWQDDGRDALAHPMVCNRVEASCVRGACDRCPESSNLNARSAWSSPKRRVVPQGTDEMSAE